jgi:N-methylhydantoinase B
MINAQRPAPVSMSTVGMVQTVRNLILIVLSKMLGASAKHSRRATGVWAPTNQSFHLSTTSLTGEYIGHHGTDTFAGSGGARAFRDGVDVGGMLHAPASRWANAERHEMNFPYMYLFRRVVPDSGGAGKYRGGVSHEFAAVPHQSGANKFTTVLMPGRGGAALNSQGVFGGYPGCNTASVQLRNTKERFPYDVASAGAEHVDRVGLGVTDINAEDILYIRYDGAGGYGDPLDRDPELVLHDVLWELVTEAPARDVYGVVFSADKKRVDSEATQARRVALRTERLNGKKPKADLRARAEIARTPYRLGEYLQVVRARNAAFVQCTWCGERICPPESDWKEHVVSRKSPPSKAGPLRVDSGKFFLLEFFCPGCATALDVDIALQDDPPLHDRVSSWPQA